MRVHFTLQTKLNSQKRNSASSGFGVGHVKLQQGFTLVEMLVAVSIFAIVMVTSMGTLIVLLSASTSAQSTQSITTNLSFTLDRVTRNIRTGYDYYCIDSGSIGNSLQSGTRDCAAGATGFIFTDAESGNRTAYRINAGVVQQKVTNAGSWLSLTSEDVVVEDLRFYTNGSTSGDATQAYVGILLKGSATVHDIDSPVYYMQSTVVQRTIDY